MVGGKTNNMYIKYNRTFHLPWSLGKTSDDKTLSDVSCFENKQVVVTEKLDGENTTLYKDYFHARSLDGRDHPSRSWVKQFHATFKHEIEDGYRICGENLYAKHSIGYDNLKSYFYCFNIWDDNNYCISWKDTVEYCEYLGIETVPVLYEGIFDEDLIKNLNIHDNMEGYVVRNSHSFPYDDFKYNIAKYVRANHVVADTHWMHSEVIPNKLIKTEV
jgi:hypothetical protein